MSHESEILEDFSRQWTPSSFCRIVREFVVRHPELSLAEKVEMVQLDQAKRWNVCDPAIVEDYVEEFPDLLEDPNVRLSLIQSEISSAKMAGTSIETDDLAIRFPDLQRELKGEIREKKACRQVCQNGTASSENTFSFSYSAFSETSTEHRYARLWRLGVGTFGEAWVAFDTLLRRRVAIKVARCDDTIQQHQRQAFVDEARRLARLNHPGIVQIHDFGHTSQGSAFIVSKLYEGETLQSRILKGPLPVNECVQIIGAITEALHHSHMQGIIHRDIKPANIIIEKSTHRPVLLDFGLAVHAFDASPVNRIVGTPAYMSPEQTPAHPQALRIADARTDVFSVGIILYEMLTGVRPFAAGSRMELFEQIANTPAQPPHLIDSRIPESLSDICLKALEKEPRDRFQSAEEMRHAIQQWSHSGLLEGRPNRKSVKLSLSSLLNRIDFLSCFNRRAMGIFGAVFFGLTMVLGTIVRLKLAEGGELVIQCDDPNAEISVELTKDNVQKVFALCRGSDNKFVIDVGEWRATVSGIDYSEFTFEPETIAVKSGETSVVTVRRIRPPLQGTETEAIRHLLSRNATLILRKGQGAMEEIRVEDLSELPTSEFIVTGVWFPEHTSPATESLTPADVQAICSFPHLDLLDLSTTAVSNQDLDWISKIQTLRALILRNTAITDAAIDRICQLRKLLVLGIGQTQVTSAGITRLYELPSLVSLQISGSSVTDETLELIAKQFPSLNSLSCQNTNITDHGVQLLLKRRGWENLCLSHNQLTDTAVSYLRSHETLKSLDLSDTQVSDNCVNDLMTLKSLRHLNLSDTRFTPNGLRQLSAIPELFPKISETPRENPHTSDR